MDGITIGAQVLSPTGRVWTVRSITPSGSRVVLTTDEADGEHSIIVDGAAVLRMVPIESAPVERELAEPTPAAAA